MMTSSSQRFSCVRLFSRHSEPKPAAGVCRTYAGNENGAAIIEFSLILPVFLALFIGVAEVSAAYYVSSLLEAGVRQASRMGVVGSAPDGGDLMQAIEDTIERAGNGLIDMTDVKIEMIVYESFEAVGDGEEELNEDPCTETLINGVCFVDGNGNGTFDESSGQPGLGGPNDIVLYRVTYDWPSMTGYFGTLFGGEDEAITLTAAIAVRNEPF